MTCVTVRPFIKSPIFSLIAPQVCALPHTYLSPLRLVNTGAGPDLPPPRDATGSFELASVDSQMRPFQILVQRARNDFEPVVGPRVPPPLASLLVACLAVSPESRPTATEARIALASLASQARAWDAVERGGAGGTGGSDTARGPPLSSLPPTRSVNSFAEAMIS